MIARNGAVVALLGFFAILAFSSGAMCQTVMEEDTLPLLEDSPSGTGPVPVPVAGDVPVPAPISSEAERKVPLPAADEAEFDAGGVTASPDPKGPDIYYDSATVPVTGMSREAGPRKPDPRKEPASRLIVVEKNYGAGSAESRIVAAERALKLGRYSSAVELYEGLNKINSRDPRILMGLAVAYQKNGQDEAAMRAYRNMLNIYPDNLDARSNMLGLLREKAPAEALGELLDLREKDPSNAGIVAQIGLAHAALGNYEDAMRYLGMASSMSPEDPLHIYNMAVVADMKGDIDTALDLYRKSLEADAVYGSGGALSRDVIYDRLSVLRN